MCDPKIGDLVVIKKKYLLRETFNGLGIVISMGIQPFNPMKYELGLYFQNGSTLWFLKKELSKVFSAKI